MGLVADEGGNPRIHPPHDVQLDLAYLRRLIDPNEVRGIAHDLTQSSDMRRCIPNEEEASK